MNEHIQPGQIDRFLRKELGPEEMLAVSDHLSVCDACRAICRPRSISALRDELSAAREDHLSYEQLEATVDGRLDDIESEIVASHLEVCPQCAQDFGALRQARAALPSMARPAARPGLSLPWRLLPLAGSLAALLVFGWLSVRKFQPRPRTAPVEQAARPPLPPVYQQLIDRALAAQAVELPPSIARLRGRPGTLLGARTQPSFRILGPAGTVVESATPLFRWTPAPPARTYVVSIFDAQLKRVASSGNISTTEWTPPQALLPGREYLWQVAARGPGIDLLAPAPPEAEARFQVLDAEAARDLAAARRDAARSHLALGLVYAKHGLLEDAVRELRAAGPGEAPPETLSRLLAQIESARHW